MKKKSYFTSGSGARKAFVSSFQDKTELNEVIDSNNESKIIDKIFHKSSENMSELENNSVSLTVTSPPYNIGKDSDLDLTDDELKDLNGLDSSYTTDPKGPFYKSILDKAKKEKKDVSSSGNYEPGVDEISKDDIINDEYFHRDDT